MQDLLEPLSFDFVPVITVNSSSFNISLKHSFSYFCLSSCGESVTS